MARHLELPAMHNCVVSCLLVVVVVAVMSVVDMDVVWAVTADAAADVAANQYWYDCVCY